MNRLLVVIMLTLYLAYVGYALSALGHLDKEIKDTIFKWYGVEQKE